MGPDSPGRWWRGHVATTGVLLVLLLGTWALRGWDVARLADSADMEAERRTERVAADVQQELSGTFLAMERDARAWARSTELIAALRAHRSGDPRDPEGIVRFVSAIETDGLSGMEVYDPVPRLQAWAGPLIPLDDGPEDSRFLEKTVFRVSLDSDRRTALVAWYPVLDGTEIVGAVRVLRLVENRVPLRNEYLRDFTWSEEWSRETGMRVVFRFGATAGPGARTLEAPDGTPVGSLRIWPPDQADILAARTAFYTDLMVLWTVLGLLYGLGSWTRHVIAESKQRPTPRHALRLVLGSLFLMVGVRWALLAMDVPARWQAGKTPLAPLFDPQHLATTFGFGAFRTTGDLVITVMSVVFVAWTLLLVSRRVAARPVTAVRISARNHVVLFLGQLIVAGGLGWLMLSMVQRIILDSTLDYTQRSGLVPETLVIVVLAALLVLLLAFAVIAARALRLAAAMSGAPDLLEEHPARVVILGSLAGLVAAGLLAWTVQVDGILLFVFVMVTMAWAIVQPFQPSVESTPVALRIVLPALLLGALLLYPMIDAGMSNRRVLRMDDASQAFMEERDARVLFAIEQVLDRATVPGTIPAGEDIRLDSTSTRIVEGSLARSLGSHDIAVTILTVDGLVRGRYTDLDRQWPGGDREEEDFPLLRAMYEDAGQPPMMIEKVTDPRNQYRFSYVGMAPVQTGGFVVVRAVPRPWASGGVIPFPRVLVPAGYYGTQYADLSIAEFKDGVLVRAQGDAFGRTFLDPAVREALRRSATVMLQEQIRDRTYTSFYNESENGTVIGVRESALNLFDHLYFLLRVIVSGLFVAIPVYLVVIVVRFRSRHLRAQRRFRDKVLNAFFGVGIVTVAAMGFVGLRVVTGENERAIESWLRQHLDRVEDALLLEARPGELPFQVLERMDVDSLAARVGLDVNVYHNTTLEKASRPELVRDRLIEERLPVRAYEALYFDGFRFVTDDQQLGSFRYTAGFRSLPDEQGQPHYVVGIPTLPEQERIEEERARTLAYLFGALLLLVLVVMFTASILANALTRPIAQLQHGLRAVAAGHFQRIGPLGSRDEISELVDSFNTMQDQLEESRNLLSQQERQLAWREMARQVAHEIKNPLTPMKLSIQHLQRAFLGKRETDDGFPDRFQRTTDTLIEQIGTLARIADEFSSFGRMPTHVRESIDLNAVIREAVDLMQAEERVDIGLSLTDAPLHVSGDHDAVRRMYINFIKNAIQAVPDGRTAHIRISTSFDEGNEERPIVSRIADNGVGIPEDLRDRIFVPSFSTKTSGTGLGLAIAKRTIEAMDGDIGFDSMPGQGTTFWIRLPADGD